MVRCTKATQGLTTGWWKGSTMCTLSGLNLSQTFSTTSLQGSTAQIYPLQSSEITCFKTFEIKICECVRSIINFHLRNQDVDFVMFEMLFGFQCTKYNANRWQKKKRGNSPNKTIRLFCTIVTHSVLLYYTAIGHFRWVR